MWHLPNPVPAGADSTIVHVSLSPRLHATAPGAPSGGSPWGGESSGGEPSGGGPSGGGPSGGGLPGGYSGGAAPGGGALARLTPREREVMAYLCAGQPNKVIAIDLGISMRTAEAHRARIFRKLGVRNVQQLVCLTCPYRLCALGGLSGVAEPGPASMQPPVPAPMPAPLQAPLQAPTAGDGGAKAAGPAAGARR
ncbi:MAG: helix-turn-helix transcriptional regulator [Bordetella sp.]|nr:helix-turn-helix transcriptional regulator [Bordetella sp.]